MSKFDVIVVTGATGFIAKHVIAMLLNAGHQVRGTLRNVSKGEGVLETLNSMVGHDLVQNFSLFECDLLSDDGWGDAMDGADAVMHIATYVPAREPKNAQTVIRPALEGTERVMGFAASAGVKRIVMTSSIAAIGYGHKVTGKHVNHDGDDWTDLEGLGNSWAYAAAKTLSEKRAWELANEMGIDLTCVCPSMVFGPAIDTDTSASLKVILRLMNGQVPALPPGGMSVVDVRDVAQIHVDALSNQTSFGRRIISSAHYITFEQVSEILRVAYPHKNFPSYTAPVWLMKFLGKFERTIKQIAADLDSVRYYDGGPGEQLMARDYRDGQEAVLSAAKSLIKLGMVKP